jgi:uncharacterized membrane protein YsdA (DUF1294 family)/cold shock CspA family protein
MRFKGTLVDWKDDRGFGFIEPANGGARVFCHVKAFEVRVRRPISGDRVTYVFSKDEQGRLNAAQVRPEGLEDASYKSNVGFRRREQSTHRASSGSATLPTRSLAFVGIGLFAFFACVVALVIARLVSYFVPLIYMGMSCLTFLVYAFDKSAAMNRRWRTQEQTLHALELLGGWPGAWLAQNIFRHKSRKVSFRVTFWFCVIVNIAFLTWYSTLQEPQRLF